MKIVKLYFKLLSTKSLLRQGCKLRRILIQPLFKNLSNNSLFSSLDPVLSDFEILLAFFVLIFLTVLFWIMVNCDILFRRPVTDHEILQETIRQIYHLTAQGGVI